MSPLIVDKESSFTSAEITSKFRILASIVVEAKLQHTQVVACGYPFVQFIFTIHQTVL
jgi:hypothetical protein